MAEGGGLLNRYRGVNLYRGFESLLLRFGFCFKQQGSFLTKVALLLFHYLIVFCLTQFVKSMLQISRQVRVFQVSVIAPSVLVFPSIL